MMRFTLGPNSRKQAPVDLPNDQRNPGLELDRRHLLKLGVASVLATALPGPKLHAQSTLG